MIRNIFASVVLCLAATAVGAEQPVDILPTPDEPLEGVITAGRLNVRLRPDTSAPVLGQLMRDARVVVRRVAAGWCEIDMPPTFGVWISEKLAMTSGEVTSLAEGETIEASVLRSGARLRSTPSLRGAILGECAKDSKLGVLRTFNGWLRVVAPADLRAYVHSDYVKLGGPPDMTAIAAPKVGPGPAPASPRGAVPEAAAARIALAGEVLSDEKCSLEEMRRALGLLEEALAPRQPGAEVDPRVAARVRMLLGKLPPSRWLELFDEAAARHGREVEAVERAHAQPLREARRALDEAEPQEYTARGTLLAPAPGSGAYRLVHGDTLLYEIDTGGRDLGVFVGKFVGVVGETRRAATPGGVPVVGATHVEELDPEAPGGI